MESCQITVASRRPSGYKMQPRCIRELKKRLSTRKGNLGEHNEPLHRWMFRQLTPQMPPDSSYVKLCVAGVTCDLSTAARVMNRAPRVCLLRRATRGAAMERACVRRATLTGAAQGLDMTMGAIVLYRAAGNKITIVQCRGELQEPVAVSPIHFEGQLGRV